MTEDGEQLLFPKTTEHDAINNYQRDILIFDKDETLIHILSPEDYSNDNYKRQINGEWSISFVCDVSLSSIIVRKNKVAIYDREGRLQIFSMDNIRERYSKKPQIEVFCIHDSFSLNDTVLEEVTKTCDVNEILDQVLVGTNYKRGYTDVFDVQEVEIPLTSRYGGLETIANTFGGELDFRFTLDGTKTKVLNRYVDIKFSLGVDLGLRFTFDTNLTEVVKTTTSNNHFTALYGLGRAVQNGETKPNGEKIYKRIDFGEVEWSIANGDPIDKPLGQRHIGDINAITKWGRIEGIYVNESITDPALLLKRTYEKLKSSKDPQTSYSVSVEDLARIAGYEHLNVKIGDTVIIKDEEFELQLVARIQEEQYSIRENIIKKIEATSVISTLNSIPGISGVSGAGSKKLVLGVIQRNFTDDTDGSNGGTISPPGPSGGVDPGVDDNNFPDTLPAIPVISGEGLFSTIMLSWTFNNSLYYGYELHGSQIENFTITQNTILARGKLSAHLHQCKPGEKWYFKVRAYNTHGNFTSLSNEIALETSKIADGADWFESAAIGDAYIGTLRLDRGWVGHLTGDLIEARKLKVINDDGIETIDVDSKGDVSMNVKSLNITATGNHGNVPTKPEVDNSISGSIDENNKIVDNQINVIIEQNLALQDFVILVTSDGYVTDNERTNLARVWDEIKHQYELIIGTVGKFNNGYLNSYRDSLILCYNTLEVNMQKILNNDDTAISELRESMKLYNNAYSDVLAAISSITKDEMTQLDSKISIEKGRIDFVLTEIAPAIEGFDKLSKHMTFTSDGWLEIYATINGEEAPFKLQLTDREVAFYENGSKVAYINNNKLNIENAEIRQTLAIGSYVMLKSAKNGIVFKKG